MRLPLWQLRLGLLAVFVVAVALRAPFIARGLPFFYQEDEAHHFQRTVQMVKDGSFDPKYFNKPSLHFYLRMPVVAASFISAVKAGELRRVDELVTRTSDPRGGWAFVASHPRVAVWNRAFGVFLGVLVLAPVFALARTLTGDDRLALGAALLAAVSPALAADAAKIGVDTPLVLATLLAMWLAMRLHARFTTGGLVLAAIVAGLAISTKYNAAPIALLPLVACLAAGQATPSRIALALTMPVAGFLIGTPYSVLSLPEFLNGIAFEAWHYGTAGHGHATGEPGLPQAWYYVRWLARSYGLGLLAAVLAAAGAAALLVRRDARAATFLAFPAAFFVLMALQKVNFTRNLLPLLPAMSVLAAVAVSTLAGRARWSALLLPVACLQPAYVAVRSALPVPADSRTVAADWLNRVAGPRSETAVAWSLAWPPAGPMASRATGVDPRQADAVDLYVQGFDRLVADASFAPTAEQQRALRLEHVVAGGKIEGRIPISPEVRIYRVVEPLESELAARLLRPEASVTPPVRYRMGEARRAGGASACWQTRGADGIAAAVGGDCWLPGRVSRLMVEAGPAGTRGATVRLEGELYSPWPDQRCVLSVGVWQSADLCAGNPAARWHAISADIPAAELARAGSLTVRVQEVHPYPGRPRPVRTGLAVRALRLE